VTWEPLTLKRPLTNARIALHWAAQIPSAAGATLIAPREDSSHTSLTWDRGSLASENGASLRFEDFTIAFRDVRIPLEGLLLETAIAKLAAAMNVPKLERPAHDLPDHPVGKGSPFQRPDPSELAELARWYSNAHAVLSDRGTVRVWPHHFDIAVLLELGDGKTIGVGMSPGDSSYDEPYFYVTPWPHPEMNVTLPDVTPGQWHMIGWYGAVLRAKKLLSIHDHQREAVQQFFTVGIEGCRMVLGLPARA